jgi:Concanavalin A-like lectin/glucanases superfamily/PEP-CTERM motif
MNTSRKNYFLLAIVASAVVCAVPHAVQAGLIMHLTGNGSALDSSGNSNHGTLNGNATYGAGVRGNAFLLDGAGDYVSIANNPALEPVSALSVAAWVKMDPISSQVLIMDSSHGWIDTKGWFLQTHDDGRIGFGFGNGPGNGFPEVISTIQIDNSIFHHIAGVFDGTKLSIYVDGAFEGETNYSGTPTPSGRELRIGASWGGGTTTREVNGLIDDVRVYNHVLNASEINSISAVPEPSSFMLLGILGLGYSFRIRKRRNKPEIASTVGQSI